jgi:hypothetical protein
VTPEQRLDRLERIMKLMVRAGLRARRRDREQDEKINMIIDAQVKNEERFAKIAEAQAENEERFAKLAAYQEHTDQRLDVLIDIIREQRNGRSN